MNPTKSFNLNHDIAMDEEIHRFRENLASNQEVILRGVINRILGTNLQDDLLTELGDGIILCKLFKKLVPDRNIRDPNSSPNLSILQKRDNISLFTNACRSIHIPDVLLITNSYFDNMNHDLLVSGLFTFFIWVLNLGIPKSASRVTMNTIFDEANSESVSDCIVSLSNRLCGISPMCLESGGVSCDFSGVNEFELDANECPSSFSNPNEFNSNSSESPSSFSNPNELNSTQSNSNPTQSNSNPNELNSNLSNPNEPNPNESPIQPPFSKQEWMKLHGVEPIHPDIDTHIHRQHIDKRVSQFINTLTNTVDLEKPILIAEKNTIQARIVSEEEAPMLSDDLTYKPSVLRPRPHNPSRNSGRKRRNIDMKNVKSRVFDQPEKQEPSLRYVERIGNPRLVAGAIMQPRYIEGVDGEGVVRHRIQVRSVVSHPFPRLSTVRPAAEVMVEPEYPRGGLFGEEQEEMGEISDEQIVKNALYDEHGEISQEVLEDRLDRDIRESAQISCFCLFQFLTNNMIYDYSNSTTPLEPSMRIFIPLFTFSVKPGIPTTHGIPNSLATTLPWVSGPPISIAMAAVVENRGVQLGSVAFTTNISPL